VRVASAELAEVLRTEHAGLEIVCAPRPEVDGLLAALHERLSDEDCELEQSYFLPEIEPDAMRAFWLVMPRVVPHAIPPGERHVLS
jgi:hypothetical protein